MPALVTKKILFFVNVDWFFWSHRLPVALAAIDAGYEVHIMTRLTDKKDELLAKGLIVHDFPFDRNSQNILSVLFAFFRVLYCFQKIKPDLLHAVTIEPILLGGAAARIVRVPSVVLAISGLGFIFVKRGPLSNVRRFLVQIFYRFVLGHPKLKVIFQNEDDLMMIKGFSNLNYDIPVLIPGSGADLSCYQRVSRCDDRSILVVFASRLLADKGVREFVQAAQLLKRESVTFDKVRFIVVGEPDPDNPTSIPQRELKTWSQQGVVEIWGFRRDMPSVLSQATFVVLPSYYREGVPKILIEASACGRAIITTDMPGCRDAIEPGVTGILVPPRDVVALADAMRKLILDQALCESMGVAGRRRAELLFDEKSVVAKHLSIYNELCPLV